MSWQPIETAPKDGTTILLFVPGRGRRVALGSYTDSVHLSHGREVYANRGWSVQGDFVPLERPVPTHWHPLPAPPIDDESKQCDASSAAGSAEPASPADIAEESPRKPSTFPVQAGPSG